MSTCLAYIPTYVHTHTHSFLGTHKLHAVAIIRSWKLHFQPGKCLNNLCLYNIISVLIELSVNQRLNMHVHSISYQLGKLTLAEV